MKRITQLKPQKRSKNGTVLCGDIRALYSEESSKYTVVGSYVHAIYEPLKNSDEISQLKLEVPFLSQNYLNFLKKSNGLNVFSDSFCLYGFGRVLSNGKYIVSRDSDIVLPFHLGDYNKDKKESYIVGSFCERKIINDTANQCYCLLDANGKIVSQWKDINELIYDCIDKLSACYDINGKSKSPVVVGKIIFNKTTKLI